MNRLFTTALLLLCLAPVVPAQQPEQVLVPAVSLRVGQSTQLISSLFQEGSSIPHGAVSWITIPAELPPSCVTVSQAGWVTATAPGTCGVTAMLIGEDGQPIFGFQSVMFTVREVGVITTITISTTTGFTALVVGDRLQFVARVLDQYGEPMPLAVKWKSTKIGVLSIGSNSGLATARAPGAADVYAYIGTLQSSPVTVTVTEQ